MSDYMIGKDVGELFTRVKNLEAQAHSPKDSDCGGDEHAISNEKLFESLHKAAPNKEVFAILQRLVTDAGHITIRDLFSCTKDGVNPSVVSAIESAKDIGFSH